MSTPSLRGLVHRDAVPLIERAAEQGWTIKTTRSGVILRSPDGISTAGCHRTPRDHHWFRNFVAEMRRGGYRD